jgi:FSR family fosmidomycin resistance protein-like MFS transporter
MNTEIEMGKTEFNTKKVATVATAHGVHDTYTAFLPALLPVLIEKFTLTNTAAGFLSVFLQAPSLLQPLFGHLADRKNLRIITVLAPAITGIAMSLLVVAPGYGFLIVLLLLAGISSSALHAVSPGIGSYYSGKQLGKGMSFWMVGGELGRSLGPLLIVTSFEYLKFSRIPWLMLGGIITSVFLYRNLRFVSTITQKEQDQISWKSALSKMRHVMIPMTILLFARSLMTASLTIYLPTYLTSQGTSLWVSGASLTILQISGVIGTIFAGNLSDRYGRRVMLLISYITSPILMFLFVNASGFLQIALLIFLGITAIAIGPVLLALVHENAVENRSFANGIFMAVSFLLNALAILIVGIVSDLVDLRFTFLIAAGLVPLGIPLIFLLPKSKRLLNN